MKLLAPFWYVDWSGRRWETDSNPIDGASIPRALWTAIGSPYTGRYRRASIVHDTACRTATTGAQRKTADKMFYQACRDGGCTRRQATILYIGVRIGAILDGPRLNRDERLEPQAEESAEDRERQALLSEVANDPMVVTATETDDVDIIDGAVQVAGTRALAASVLLAAKGLTWA